MSGFVFRQDTRCELEKLGIVSGEYWDVECLESDSTEN